MSIQPPTGMEDGVSRAAEGTISLCDFSFPAAALQDADEEVLLVEDTLSTHTDLTDNEPSMYEVRKQFMR